ncbi:MAG: SRPBCC family protein [Muribaculaceae bacterium]|nr:SRPBCC family protein [Muribaculaceae bacterium]
MAISNIKAVLPGDIHKVWEIITDIKNYGWRSDLSKTEIVDEKQFIEYTKDGYPTTFTITVTKPYERWEFDMENSNMSGHWTGLFRPKDGQTEIDFMEEVTVKKPIMKLFIKSYLKKQQGTYLKDLKKAVELS